MGVDKKTAVKLAGPAAVVIAALIAAVATVIIGLFTKPTAQTAPSAPPAATAAAPAAAPPTSPSRIQIGGIGDNNTVGQIGDNNLNVTVQPSADEKRPDANSDPKPPFNPTLRRAPGERKTPPTAPSASSPTTSAEPSPPPNASEPVRVIALSEKPHAPGRVFNENLTEHVPLSGVATAGVVSAAAVAGTLSTASLSVLEPECGTAAFGASLEDVVLTTPPPHGDLLCHVRVQRTGYADVTREIRVAAEQ